MWYCVMGLTVLDISKGRSAFFQGSSHWSLNMEALGSSIAPRTTHPVTQYYRAEDLNPQEERRLCFVVVVTQYSTDASNTLNI
jgi:hypothetical protein